MIANHISADWSTRVIGGLRVKVGAAVGTDSGINAFVDGEGKVTSNVRAGLMVQVALGGGVTMRIKYVVPIQSASTRRVQEEVLMLRC